MIYDLQKASLWKRVSAFLFDFIISSVLVVGVVLIFVWTFNFQQYSDTLDAKRVFYAEKHGILVEETKGEIKIGLTYEEYNKLTDEQKEDYNHRLELSNKDIAKDVEAIKAYNMIIYLPVAFLTVGIFIVYIGYDFILPLIFKNGQSLGKKIFGIGVIRTNCVKASGFSLFVRMAFGKFVIETMVPITIAFITLTGLLSPLVARIVLLGIFALELVVYLVTKRTRSTIHDLIADTAVVDLSTQLVFESEQELIDYKTKIHEENVARAPY